MYGLLLEGLRNFVKEHYGEDMWFMLVRKAELEVQSFSTHEVYSETYIPRLVETAAAMLNLDKTQLIEQNGTYFVTFLSQFGYDGVLRVLGRNLRDFLNGLDNLHEYLRFTYRKLRPPSFFCVNESRTGITLQYRTRRKGFVPYVIGMIMEISKTFYQVKMAIDIVSFDEDEEMTNCVMRLTFNNEGFSAVIDDYPVSSDVFFEVFPFNIVFNRGLNITNVGNGLINALPEIIGKNVTEEFILCRPMIEFTWNGVMLHTNNIFEIMAVQKIEDFETLEAIRQNQKRKSSSGTGSLKQTLSSVNASLKLRGQMKYMEQWDALVFLGTPQLRDTDTMQKAGLFVNDLSMHDSSRDMVLAGEQQQAELKLALQQQEEKSELFRNAHNKMARELKRYDDLLYQMIPRTVADRLRSEGPSANTCSTFEDASILFSDVVGMTDVIRRTTPAQAVDMLNTMYQTFDELTGRHMLLKVQSVNDVYILASGLPNPSKFHAAFMAEMALDMVKAVESIRNPAESLAHMKIRVGFHSGVLLAGVVGLRLPRYCLFGETLNIASQIHLNSEAQRVHISESSKKRLDKTAAFRTSSRGEVDIKGKGFMQTYWLDGKGGLEDPNVSKLMFALESERQKLGGNVCISTIADDFEIKAVSRSQSNVSHGNGGVSGVATPVQ